VYRLKPTKPPKAFEKHSGDEQIKEGILSLVASHEAANTVIFVSETKLKWISSL